MCHLIVIKTALEKEEEGNIPVKGHISDFNNEEFAELGFEYG